LIIKGERHDQNNFYIFNWRWRLGPQRRPSNGGIEKPDGNKCKGYYGSFDIDLFKKNRSGEFGGYEDLEDYPQMTISAPIETVLVIKNSIAFVTAEELGATDLDLRFCGKVNLGDVTGELRANIRGSADVTALDVVKILNINASGASEVDYDGTAENADLIATGASDIYVGKVTAELRSKERGAADISVRK